MIKINKLEIIGLVLFVVGISCKIIIVLLFLTNKFLFLTISFCFLVILIGIILLILENYNEKKRRKLERELAENLKKQQLLAEEFEDNSTNDMA